MKRVAVKKTDEELIADVLGRGLVHLNTLLTDLTRREVAVLLWHEVNNGKRWDYVRRLHQRLGKLRSKEEFKELCAVKNPETLGWLKQEVP